MGTKLKLTEKHYRYLFENASDAMWVHDMKGNIMDINKACEKLTGYTREELVGMNIRSFFVSREYLDLAREVRRKLLAGEDIVQPYEQRLLRKDGAVKMLSIATSSVILDGKVRGFQHVVRDVTEQRRMRENMDFYIQQITRAQEDERNRIARELHDEASPPILLLIQRLDTIASTTRPRLPKHFESQLENLHDQAVEALEGLRRCAQDLRPRILDDLGLLPALEWMAEDLVKNHGVDTHVEVKGNERRLPAEIELLLFRIAQGALSNIRRHADASKAWLTMEFGEDKIILAVSDNGKGFELPGRIGDLAGTGKLGLVGMQERARLAGGSLRIQSESGQGTQVVVQLPLPE